MVFKIVLSVFVLLSSGLTLGKVGQYREPITGGEALLTLIINGVIVGGLWAWC